MRTEQIRFPEGYGTPSELLAWEDVRQQLVEAKQFWFAFERPGRSPHVTPLDGIWFEDKLVYGGSPETLHRRLAAEHPKVTVNLPDPWKLVVIEGEVRTTTFAPATAEEIAGLLEREVSRVRRERLRGEALHRGDAGGASAADPGLDLVPEGRDRLRLRLTSGRSALVSR